MRVKASKIVAGHEAEKTNEFLQLLSIAILKKVSKTNRTENVFLRCMQNNYFDIIIYGL